MSRKKIVLTIWQWPSGEVTAFLDQLRIDGEYLDLQEPKLITQLRLAADSTPSVILAALADSWGAER